MINKVDLDKLLKSKKISQSTYDKVTIAKQIIEQKYNMKNIKNSEMNQIFSKIDSLNISQSQKEQIKQEIHSQESAKYRKLREKQSIRDYTSLAIIGRGAFGEVHVCREKKTGQIVAVKKIRKDVLKIKNQVIHVRNEQLFMSKVKSPWVVELKASFQEDDYLYLVMEYLPGGDFMNLLIKKDILTEDEAKFYTAELILAIENIHKLDCIHRDIKPDNVLIDKTGHIKLSDFGLAKVSPKIFEINYNNNENIDFKPDTHQKNYSCVGTAYYVAPEVLKKKGYGPEVDGWSVGVIFFEMLFGYAPFHSKETNQVCHKVLNWQKYLVIPSKIKISKEAEDLIWKLINNSNQRLGIGGAEEIKKHPFFKDVDWDNIRNTKAPFIPKLKNDYDTHYFETLEEKEPFYPNRFNKKQKRKDIEFMGYTFKEGDFNEFNLENEFLNSIEGIKYINRDKSNGESFEHSSNSSSNLENGGKNKSNGIDKNVNNIPIHLENKISNENNEDNNKFLITKRLNKSKEKINKIKINNDNNNNIIYSVNNISDKASILSKQNTTMHTISYNKSPQSNSNNNNNIIATSSKKFKKKINICINSNNSSNNNDNIFLNDKFNMTKNLKTEPNSNINKESSIRNYFEYQNNHNHSNKNNNTKLNVIQLPTKKISTNKIIIKENGASISSSNSNPKYDIKKNLISSSLNKKKYFPNRYSPQPNEILFKKFLILKSKSKKKNLANYPPLSKSSEKGVTKKNHLFKSIINQNAIKKKYIGINSAKSIFAEKKNTQNNNLNNLINSNNDIYYNNCMTERKFTLTNQNEKVSYIYQKKL